MVDPRRMPALRTTVIGSYPFPGWLEFASQHLDEFGPDDLAEMQDDAVIAAVHDQMAAGLDVITDGEQTRLDFNLSFYGCLDGIDWRPRRPAAGARRPTTSAASTGSSVNSRPARTRRGRGIPASGAAWLPKPGAPVLKASVPGPYTLSGRLLPNAQYPDRYALDRGTVAAGCAPNWTRWSRPGAGRSRSMSRR